MDVHDPEVRSYNMRQIRGKNTKPELIVRKFLHANGFRFRLHDNKLAGTPDIVLKKHRIVINIHGCFWHGHEGCKYFVLPKTRTNWWLEKIQNTRYRDAVNSKLLKVKGWREIVIWECELKASFAQTTLENLKLDLEN